MQLIDFNTQYFPIWVELRGIPLELQTREGLSHIASVVGVPLYVDRETEGFSKVNSAKVCVEIHATDKIPELVEVEVEQGESFIVYVCYNWKPVKCQNCGLFGHADRNCDVKKGKVQETNQGVDKGKRELKNGFQKVAFYVLTLVLISVLMLKVLN